MEDSNKLPSSFLPFLSCSFLPLSFLASLLPSYLSTLPSEPSIPYRLPFPLPSSSPSPPFLPLSFSSSSSLISPYLTFSFFLLFPFCLPFLCLLHFISSLSFPYKSPYLYLFSPPSYSIFPSFSVSSFPIFLSLY